MLRVTHIVSGDVWGGAETQALQLLSNLKNLDCEPSLLLFDKGELWDRVCKTNLPFELVDESKRLGFSSRCLQALNILRPQVVVAHGYKECFVAYLYNKQNKVPFIDIHHGISENRTGLKKLKSNLYRNIRLKVTRKNAFRVLSVSHSLAGELSIDNWLNHEVIYNSVTKPPASPEAQSTFTTHPAIVIVGRLTKVKRVDLALIALSKLTANSDTKVKLYVVGDGPEMNRLKEIASNLEINESVEFLGFRADAPSLIASADALLISSDSEGLPTVLLEAMQSKLPIVSTAVGGIPEVMENFKDYPAILVEPEDTDAMAEALQKLLSEVPVLSDDFQEKFNTLFDAKEIAKKHLSLYQSAIRSSF